LLYEWLGLLALHKAHAFRGARVPPFIIAAVGAADPALTTSQALEQRDGTQNGAPELEGATPLRPTDHEAEKHPLFLKKEPYASPSFSLRFGAKPASDWTQLRSDTIAPSSSPRAARRSVSKTKSPRFSCPALPSARAAPPVAARSAAPSSGQSGDARRNGSAHGQVRRLRGRDAELGEEGRRPQVGGLA
jgi:hypothetical protein